ncbi:hypothetical protein CTAYLR_004657 [Chrysophaeum taylorii]|uniref:Fe2OG dioxygenase domain-containing protein n=1 Tax=Chrysophaeum taylorii TaxID=2483200 RepID=A0AAD7U9D7_9STRA|nr:hypothetical protein CTAYLR_004657 [Chrysophaeum taylorii]
MERKDEEEYDYAAEEAGAGCGVCLVEPSFDGLIGTKQYDYGYLCLPSMPWAKGGVEPPMFLGKDEKLPLLLSLVMGLQHALAMVSGIAVGGGLLIAGDTCFAWQLDSEMCDARDYLVSAAWITSGLLTAVQVLRAKILGTSFYLGTGLISVMGTSFTFLPIARDMVVSEILDAQNEGKCNSEGDCVGFGRRGYGKFLGTAMVAGLFEICLALVPPKLREKFFPSVVTGVAVMLIGGALISTGIKYIGGGVFCAENDLSRSVSFGGPQMCTENGNVVLPFGAPEYVGLGFSVIAMSVFLQFFGSPFLKSTFLFWGLMFGVFVAGVTTYEAKEGDYTLRDGNEVPAKVGRQYKYFNDQRIKDANYFIFLWDTTFPIRFAPEYFLPILIGYFVSSAETIGDITMSCVASRIPASGKNLEQRIQGGLLADGLNSILACLFTSPPNTTFSENNGIIALTACASRSAGFSCAFWLILFGIIGKLGAAFNSIPICVVGGIVLQCFAMVFVSGVTIATSNFTRRNAFILMLSLGFGLGVAMEPNLFEGGGGFGYYSQNLNFVYGFWPRFKTCKEFPRVDATTIIEPAYCTVNNFTWTSEDEEFATHCVGLEGLYVDAVTVTTNDRVKTCVDDNGDCCVKYDKGKKSNRTTAITILKTPYCLGFVTALILHLLLPEDKLPGEDDKDKKNKPEPQFKPVEATAAIGALDKNVVALMPDSSTSAKEEFAYESAASNRGYIAMGLERLDAETMDLKETFDVGDEKDPAYRNRWPSDDFRDAMLAYFEAYDELYLDVMRAIAIGMGYDEEFFTSSNNGNHQNLRLLHYPSVDRAAIGRQKRGGIHTDYGTLTLLSQDTVSGLRALRLDGSWVDVEPIPGGIVVNVGEMLQRVSNDKFRATPHQVVDDFDNDDPTVPERFSIAFFCNWNKDLDLDCLPGCSSDEDPFKYDPVNAHDYITGRLQGTISHASSARQ